MFSAGLLFSAGATIALVTVEKILDETGFHWFGTVLKIAVPLAAMLLGVYFLETNPIVGWLK